MSHFIKSISFFSVLSMIIILAIPTSAEARGRSRFGESDEIKCFQQIKLTGQKGSALCLATKKSYFYLFAGAWTSQEVVLGIPKNEEQYYPMPEGNKLVALQKLGMIPEDLNPPSRPAMDYVKGFLLWIVFAVVFLFYKAKSMFVRDEEASSNLT